jgi:hypothetical protein
MIEVFPNLYVGNGVDEAEVRGKEGWYVISAAKDPWHRKALGYTSQGAPKDHPEYLIANRDQHMILNLVDSGRRRLHPSKDHQHRSGHDFIGSDWRMESPYPLQSRPVPLADHRAALPAPPRPALCQPRL